MYKSNRQLSTYIMEGEGGAYYDVVMEWLCGVCVCVCWCNTELLSLSFARLHGASWYDVISKRRSRPTHELVAKSLVASCHSYCMPCSLQLLS